MGDSLSLKDADKKVVTPFVSAADLKARNAKQMQTSEDIHVGPNTQLSGGFSTNGMMIVDGRVDSADISADRLVVSHIGDLEGKATVQRAEISGIFSGELVAGDEVIVRPTARISGSVQCQKLVIHRGARIECSFSCVPEVVGDGATSNEGAANHSFLQRKRSIASRDRQVFLAGAASVFAVMGVLGLIVGFKMLIS